MLRRDVISDPRYMQAMKKTIQKKKQHREGVESISFFLMQRERTKQKKLEMYVVGKK